MVERIFLFTRTITGEEGATLSQAASIYAPDVEFATGMLRDELASLKSASARSEPAFETQPDWRIDAISLDEPRIVSFFIA